MVKILHAFLYPYICFIMHEVSTGKTWELSSSFTFTISYSYSYIWKEIMYKKRDFTFTLLFHVTSLNLPFELSKNKKQSKTVNL